MVNNNGGPRTWGVADLGGQPAEQVVPSAVASALEGVDLGGLGANSGDFLERLENILGKVASIVADYKEIMIRQSGVAAPAGPPPPVAEVRPGGGNYALGADTPENVYNALLDILKAVPNPETVTLADMVTLVPAMKGKIVGQLAVALEGVQ